MDGMGKQRTMSFQIDPALRELLDMESVKQDRSISWLINHYLRQGLEASGIQSPTEKKVKKNESQ
jgi:hypothetical protein